MAATKAPAATRYFQPEVTKVYVLTAVADMAVGPTRAELDGGTDVSDDISAIAGFTVATADIATPDLGKRFTGNISGRITAESSSITFYAGKDGNDVRTVLTRDLACFVVILDGGDVDASPMDVFQTTVGSVGKVRDLEDAPKLTANFTIQDFADDLVVPATV